MRDQLHKKIAAGLGIFLAAGVMMTPQAEEESPESPKVYESSEEEGITDGEFVEYGYEDLGYSVPEGWTVDEQADLEDALVLCRQDDGLSTIVCGYLDTNYSIQEYEQLREMLTNNLLYEHVNAQISTSAVYTLAKDYLYTILVDDEEEAYRDIYHYVIGDYRCFCVFVREYRSEAEEVQDQMTPREAGQSIAEGFTWTD